MLLTGFEIRSNMAVDVNFNIFSITAIIISLQGFFLGIVILKYKSAESRGNMLLALFVLAYTYSTTNIIRDFTNLVFIVPHLLWTEIPILFLLAPLFYFLLYENDRQIVSEEMVFICCTLFRLCFQ